jgi:hypothetical protein
MLRQGFPNLESMSLVFFDNKTSVPRRQWYAKRLEGLQKLRIEAKNALTADTFASILDCVCASSSIKVLEVTAFTLGNPVSQPSLSNFAVANCLTPLIDLRRMTALEVLSLPMVLTGASWGYIASRLPRSVHTLRVDILDTVIANKRPGSVALHPYHILKMKQYLPALKIIAAGCWVQYDGTHANGHVVEVRPAVTFHGGTHEGLDTGVQIVLGMPASVHTKFPTFFF